MTPPEFQADQTSADDALRRMRRLVDRLFFAIMAVVIVAAGLTVTLRYIEASGESRREARTLANLLSEYVVLRLRGIDGALTRIAADNWRIGGPEGPDREWTPAIRSAISGVPGLSSLVILDSNGIVRHTTVQQIRGLSWADRRVFQELAKGVPNAIVVDPPITMVAGSQVLVPFGRALTDTRGDFVGAAVALLLPDQLRDFLQRFDLGPTGVAWILLPTGDVLFRGGAIEPFTENTTTQEPLFADEAADKKEGIVRGALIRGGSDYMTAYHQTDFGGLIVAVSIAETSALSRWRKEALVTVTLAVIAIALLFFAARKIKNSAVDIVAAGQQETVLYEKKE